MPFSPRTASTPFRGRNTQHQLGRGPRMHPRCINPRTGIVNNRDHRSRSSRSSAKISMLRVYTRHAHFKQPTGSQREPALLAAKSLCVHLVRGLRVLVTGCTTRPNTASRVAFPALLQSRHSPPPSARHPNAIRQRIAHRLLRSAARALPRPPPDNSAACATSVLDT